MEKRGGASSLAKTALAALVGLALGWGLKDGSDRAAAQGTWGASGYREAAIADAAPSVDFGADGKATFSRPLEVPPLYAFDYPLDETGRQIILVDSETKRICVYWVRRRDVNSTIELVAARNFELDLKLEDFNGEGLSPGQIREQLDSARR
ncbi:MAG: hypothetical protein IJM30_04595 [Thermoguttaceae bacterium]|nr:hypothetical protein [Thermoguttaceae bacterium]